MPVIDFPPKYDCQRCGTPLRPATARELREDLLDPRYEQIARSAAQGRHDFEPPTDFPAWLKDITPPASWLLRCDSCGLRAYYSKATDDEAL